MQAIWPRLVAEGTRAGTENVMARAEIEVQRPNLLLTAIGQGPNLVHAGQERSGTEQELGNRAALVRDTFEVNKPVQQCHQAKRRWWVFSYVSVEYIRQRTAACDLAASPRPVCNASVYALALRKISTRYPC